MLWLLLTMLLEFMLLFSWEKLLRSVFINDNVLSKLKRVYCCRVAKGLDFFFFYCYILFVTIDLDWNILRMGSKKKKFKITLVNSHVIWLWIKLYFEGIGKCEKLIDLGIVTQWVAEQESAYLTNLLAKINTNPRVKLNSYKFFESSSSLKMFD